jgi:hypothetical protein
MTGNLTQLRICVEKPLANEEHVMKHLSDKSNSYHHLKKLRDAFLIQKMWPKDSEIKVSFVSSENTIKNVDWTPISVLKDNNTLLDPIEEEIRKLSPIEAVKKVVRERIQPIVGLKFIFVATGGHVRIGFNPHKGVFSLIGTDCIKTKDPVTTNFGWLDAGTIIHQFGHVLGFTHEHKNQSGKAIQWDDSKVYEWAKQTYGWDNQTTYYNIIERYKTDQLNDHKYDKHSIMNYFFPAYLTTDNRGSPINHKLSNKDIKYINKVYPGGRQDSSEFHMNIYGNSVNTENRDEEDGEDGEPFNWNIIGYICSGIVGILIFMWIYKKIKENTKNSEPVIMDYTSWRKTHGASNLSFTPHRYN